MKKMSLIVGATFALMALTAIHSPAETDPSQSTAAISPGPAALMAESSPASGSDESLMIKPSHHGAIMPKSKDSESSMWALMVGGLALLFWRFRMSRTIS